MTAAAEQTTTNGNGAKLPAVQQKAPLVSGGGLAPIIPRDVEQAFRLAQIIAASAMAPKSYGQDVNKIMVGMMHGMEVGFTPMASLQSIAVINGMPTIWGDGMLGLVRASGLLEDFEERLEGSGDTLAAVCIARRKSQHSPSVGTFSVADAKRAGLWGKTGPWTQYPQRMLKMRARSWSLRDGFADVLRGLRMAEEAVDMGELTERSDGTYTTAPDMPAVTAASLLEQGAAEAEPFQIVTADGVVLVETADPELWARGFRTELSNAADMASLDKLWDAMSPQLSRIDPDMADAIRADHEQFAENLSKAKAGKAKRPAELAV